MTFAERQRAKRPTTSTTRSRLKDSLVVDISMSHDRIG